MSTFHSHQCDSFLITADLSFTSIINTGTVWLVTAGLTSILSLLLFIIHISISWTQSLIVHIVWFCFNDDCTSNVTADSKQKLLLCCCEMHQSEKVRGDRKFTSTSTLPEKMQPSRSFTWGQSVDACMWLPNAVTCRMSSCATKVEPGSTFFCQMTAVFFFTMPYAVTCPMCEHTVPIQMNGRAAIFHAELMSVWTSPKA